MALAQELAAQPATARFFVPHRDGTQGPGWLSALLDYIMISADLRERAPVWRIWHPFDDPDCFADEVLRTALLTASDHFPVDPGSAAVIRGIGAGRAIQPPCACTSVSALP